MNTKKISPFGFAIVYGIILGAIPTIYNIGLVVMNLHLDYNYYGEGLGEAYTKARVYLLPVLLFIAIYQRRRTTTGALPLKEIIVLGLWIFLIGSMLVVGYNLIFRLLIEPDFSAKFYEINREEIFKYLLEAHQELGRDYTQSDMDSHVRTNGSLWIAFSANIVLNFVFTLFFSLIFGLFMRRRSKK